MEKDAVTISHVSKSFIIPHQKQDTLVEFMSHPFSHNTKERFDVLQDISFSVNPGKTFGIIGSNGSGKSTLLKIIAGVYEADNGDITINGKLVPFLELGVGFNPELTARENIYLNGTILGMTHEFLHRKFDEIVSFAELEKFVDLPVKNYSSGMYVRLAFSIAIMAEADVYLIDEVLAVGDMNFQQKSYQVFEDIKKQGKTILFVSHSLDLVKKFCDEAAVLHNGKMITITNPPDQAIATYTSLIAQNPTIS